MSEVVYDLETFPNCFLACFTPVNGDGGRIFEISTRRRGNQALYNYLMTLTKMYGFNNMAFDWPILDWFIRNPNATAEELYEVAMAIIGSDRFESIIWQPIIPQVDLFLMNHFDNKAKSTSLKKLEFNMRSELVQDLPFAVGTHLSFDEIDKLMKYNAHDVLQTKKFLGLNKANIELRNAIEPEWINQSDTGLGRKYFERELARQGVVLQRGGTPYPEGLFIGEAIFPYLKFKTPAIADALETFKRVHVQDIINDDGEEERLALLDGEPFKHIVFNLDGLEVTMGLGGCHASLNSKVVEDCDIEDLDVTSFYPSISIKNRVYPKHIGPVFCMVYEQLLKDRLKYKKGTPFNVAIKLALNSVFGSAGSKYTSFYDLMFMYAITINGQFLILSLAELLLTVPGLRLIQINTDGVTIVIPSGARPRVKALCDAWSKATMLDLEANTYKRLWMRDVNNYVAEYADGKRKLKGAYAHQREWHKNHSALIIPKAAVAAMCDGVDAEDFISANDGDAFDFMIRADLSKTARIALDDGREFRGVTRYYVSPEGNTATKFIMGLHKDRKTGVKSMSESHTRLHAGGHAEPVITPAVWACSACDEKFTTKAAWNQHRMAAHKGVKGVTVSGSKATCGCSACTEVFTSRKAWEEHAIAAHASKLVIAQRYNGGPIDYDMRFYAAEARKLVITERFIP